MMARSWRVIVSVSDEEYRQFVRGLMSGLRTRAIARTLVPVCL